MTLRTRGVLVAWSKAGAASPTADLPSGTPERDRISALNIRPGARKQSIVPQRRRDGPRGLSAMRRSASGCRRGASDRRSLFPQPAIRPMLPNTRELLSEDPIKRRHQGIPEHLHGLHRQLINLPPPVPVSVSTAIEPECHLRRASPVRWRPFKISAITRLVRQAQVQESADEIDRTYHEGMESLRGLADLIRCCPG